MPNRFKPHQFNNVYAPFREANSTLSKASREFTEGAFAPFWDAVEQAANLLAKSDAEIGLIIAHSNRYAKEVVKLSPAFNPLCASVSPWFKNRL